MLTPRFRHYWLLLHHNPPRNIMSYLFSLIVALFKGWLGFKQDSATAQGKAEQAATDLQASLDTANAEAKAAADAPTDKASLISALKDHSVAILFLISLTSCASGVSNTCPQIRNWTPQQEDEIAANLSTLPPDSPLIAPLIEWERLRSIAKACQNEGG